MRVRCPIVGISAAPDVSVVLSAFNAEAHLDAALESILGQRGCAFELIAIDDGSTDSTSTLLDQCAADPRVRVVRQENAGLTESLRRGCELARGRYIARHDAADLSHPDRLATQAAMLTADPHLSFVSCWTRVTGPGLEELWVEKGGVPPDEPLSILDLGRPWGVVGGPTHHGSVMMRRDAYVKAGGYRSEFRFGQDWDLWYRLAEQGSFQVAGEVLYTARITPGGISAQARESQQKLARLSLEALKARKALLDERPILEAARAVVPPRSRGRRAAGLYFVGEALRRRGDPRARDYFRAAIADTPWAIRSWVRLLQSALIPRKKV